MSGSLCFDVSSSDDSCSLRVIDIIRNTAEVVAVNKQVLSYTSTDSHLVLLTEDTVFVLRLDALMDPPLTASLDTSSTDLFIFKSIPDASVVVRRTIVEEVGRENIIVSSSQLLLASTHSRVFLVDQRGEGSQRIYRIFDESLSTPHDVLQQLQVPDGMGRVTRVAEGADHILVLTEKRKVWAMGTGSHGELGTGDVSSSPGEFVECDLPCDVVIEDIAAGAWHSVAITDSKDVYVWGWNRELQLGDDQEKCVYAPTPLDIDDVISIAAKECTTVLTTEDELGHLRTITYGRTFIPDDDI